MVRQIVFRVLLLSALAIPTSTRAETGGDSSPSALQLDASLGYHFSTGKYGGDQRTNIHFVPMTLTGRIEPWIVRLTIPYISVSGLTDIGSPQGGGQVLVTGNGSGLGDVTLNGAYTLSPLRDWMPFIDFGGRVKFPTADDDRGLGTGKFDYQLEIELAKVLGEVTSFANVGYRFVGNPSSLDLGNVWLASVGAVAQVAEPINAGLFLFYQQSYSPSAGDQLDLMPFLDWEMTPRWSTSTYITAGLQDGSPDFGVGLQLTFRALR